MLEKIINEKLNEPFSFEKSLYGELRAYRSIKIRKHRIVYKIAKNRVFILIIGHRREIYEKATQEVVLI